MPRQHNVVVIAHPDGTKVYCWYEDQGLETLRSCLRSDETVEVYREKMTEAKFDALEEYDGEC